jgi:hypothetical protein
MNRRRLAVALLAVAASGAVAVVLGAGGLWAHTSSRDSVNAYIKRVDDVQQQMRLPLTRLLSAYRSFSTRGSAPQVQRRIDDAERTLRTLELRLSALAVPPEATRLQRLLVKLVVQEVALAAEVDTLARFLPRFNTVAGGSRVANAQLSRSLAAIRPPRAHAVRGTPKQLAKARAAYAAAATRAALAQAAAVVAYDRSLTGVIGRLQRLRPPPVMAPAYRAQLSSLEATVAAGAALVTELHKTNRSRVAQLSRRFSVAARLAGNVAAQRAEIAAIKGYDSRVRAVGTLQGAIQTELSRLGRTLG